MHKLVVLYPRPADPDHFRKYYRDTHVPLASKMPGMRNASYGYPETLEGAPAEPFCIFTAEFDSVEAIHAALSSKEGQATAADIPNYSPGGATLVMMKAEH